MKPDGPFSHYALISIVVLSIGMGAAAAAPESIWACRDAEGRIFDILLFPDGKAVTTWTFDSADCKGERGFWHRTGNQLRIFYSDGWTDVLDLSSPETPIHLGYKPGQAPKGRPNNRDEATSIRDTMARYVGIWLFKDLDSDRFRYAALRSDGSAAVSSGMPGVWQMIPGGIRCEWDDGSIDVLKPASSGMTLLSWKKGEPTRRVPGRKSIPIRVGDEEIAIEP